MIVNINTYFSGNKIINSNQGGNIPLSSTENQEGAKEFNLYRTDEITQKENTLSFINTVGAHNPVGGMLEISDGYAGTGNNKAHVYEFVNKFKVCEIAITSAGFATPLPLESRAWGNWRTKSPGGIPVHSNVFLFPEEKNFQFRFSNDFGQAWDAVDPGGVFSKISQAAEAARSFATLAGKGETMANKVAGKMMSKYKKAPSWNGTDPISFDSIKFSFNFGQAGIFSGEHEIVRPILAIASLFVPLKTGPTYYRGVVPTPPYYLMNALKKVAGEIGNLGGDILSNIASGDFSLINTVTSVEEKAIRIQEEAIEQSLKETSRALCIRMGRMSLGPFIVKDVSWEFDFEQVDEYGFPYKGAITLGGLQSNVMPDPGQITSAWGVGANTKINPKEDWGETTDGYTEKPAAAAQVSNTPSNQGTSAATPRQSTNPVQAGVNSGNAMTNTGSGGNRPAPIVSPSGIGR